MSLHPRLNLVTGANGSGKTSLLEAVYLLGRGRSFRTRYTEQLLRHGQQRLWVAGRLRSDSVGTAGIEPPGIGEGDADEPDGSQTVTRRIDVQWDRRQGLSARLEGQSVASFATLTEAFPVQVVDPGIHRLVEEGPARRRRWLDWAVFHVEPAFVDHWQRYSRALRQRNAALAQQADPVPWEAELARLGEGLSGARARVMEALQPCWREALRQLDAVPAELCFQRGWPTEQTLDRWLARQRERDRQQRRTRLGPHRFDVVLQWEGRPAREIVSRGQQKLLGAAMVLAVTRYVAGATGRVPTLLLDDPAAELDGTRTRALLAAVGALGGQQIVTALRPEELPFAVPDRAFHVEQEGVKTV